MRALRQEAQEELVKPKPSEEGAIELSELEDDEEDEPDYDDEAPLFDPEEAGR